MCSKLEAGVSGTPRKQEDVSVDGIDDGRECIQSLRVLDLGDRLRMPSHVFGQHLRVPLVAGGRTRTQINPATKFALGGWEIPIVVPSYPC